MHPSFAKASHKELICVENKKEKKQNDEDDDEYADEQGEGEEDFVETKVSPLKPTTRALNPGNCKIMGLH